MKFERWKMWVTLGFQLRRHGWQKQTFCARLRKRLKLDHHIGDLCTLLLALASVGMVGGLSKAETLALSTNMPTP